MGGSGVRAWARVQGAGEHVRAGVGARVASHPTPTRPPPLPAPPAPNPSPQAQDTHKFESRYLDSLIGPYPGAREVYVARSPIHKASAIRAPVIFMQGSEDKVVPPNQATLMFDTLKASGVPTALLMFEGEQHGFRGEAAIRAAIDGELYFYSRVLGFGGAEVPAGLEVPVIVNAPPGGGATGA